jgi:RNA polymerase sigma factor (sigma-70 family)
VEKLDPLRFHAAFIKGRREQAIPRGTIIATDRFRVLLRRIRRLTTEQADAALTDRELLQRYTDRRDETAFAALVRRHGGMVLAVCRRVLHQEQDAEDAFQAVFVILARKASAPGWQESIGNWLYQVAYRLAVRARRQAARRQARAWARSPDRAQAHSGDPVAEVTLREAQQVLDEELNRLPEKYRSPLVLCCLAGNTQDEAARQLGWSVATLKRRLQRGRDLLGTRLRRRGLMLSALLAGLTVAENASPAAVSDALLASTVTAASASPGALSAQISVLVRAVLQSMLLSKVKVVLGMVAAVVVAAGVGAALFTLAPPAEKRAEQAVPPANEQQAQRMDRFGDPLPSGVLHRLGSVRLRHKAPIHSTTFAAEGRVLITAGDSVVRFWNPAKGQEIYHLDGQHCIACSPDGKTLATLTESSLTLWDAATGEQRRTVLLRGSKPTGFRGRLLFAPDGRRIAAFVGDEALAIWDINTGQELIHLPKHDKPIVCFDFTPDGKNILTAVGSRTEEIALRRWNSATGKELGTARIPATERPPWLRPLAFSPDGKSIALEEAATAKRVEGDVTHVSTEYRLYLANVATGRELRRLDATSEVVWSAAFSRDGRLVACQRMDGSAGVWETATGLARFIARGYPGNSRPDGIATLAFTPDGKKLATVGDSGAIHLWDVEFGREILANVHAHNDAITCLAFSLDGKTLATGSKDHTIGLWDTAAGRQRLCLRGHSRPVRQLAFSRDGKTLASAGEDDTVRLWDTATGNERHRFKEERKPRSLYWNFGVHALGFSPDGQTFLSWGEDQMLRTWDLTTGRERSARQVRFHDLSEPSQPEPGQPNPDFPADHLSWAAFTPDARTALLASNKSIYVVDVAGGREVFSFANPSGMLSCLDLSPDGQTLVLSGVDKKVHLFEVATGKEVRHVGLPDMIVRAAFAPDGRTVALAERSPHGSIRIVDAATLGERAKFADPNASVRSLAFAPDGKMLASGLSDTTAVLWEVPDTVPPSRKKELSADTLKQLWADLAGTDAAKAYAAIWALVANPEQTLPLLNEHLCAAPPIDPKRIQALIAQLGHDDFARREEAARELKKLGEAAESALRAVEERPPSLEVRRRVQNLLASPPPWTPQDAESLRRYRAIRVLEQIGSPAAGMLLEKLAQGAAVAPETRLAGEARKRLSLRYRRVPSVAPHFFPRNRPG